MTVSQEQFDEFRTDVDAKFVLVDSKFDAVRADIAALSKEC